MRSDIAFFSTADIFRRFLLSGLASDSLSWAAAAAFLGEEERRDVERDGGADAPRICSTSVNAWIFAMFVEDFRRQAPTCLAQNVRSAAIRRIRARIGDSWQSIARVFLNRHQEDAGNPGTPPCANLAARNHASGLEIVMGGRTASDPDAPPLVTIP